MDPWSDRSARLRDPGTSFSCLHFLHQFIGARTSVRIILVLTGELDVLPTVDKVTLTALADCVKEQAPASRPVASVTVWLLVSLTRMRALSRPFAAPLGTETTSYRRTSPETVLVPLNPP